MVHPQVLQDDATSLGEEASQQEPSRAGKFWRACGYLLGVALLLGLQYRLWFSDVGFFAQREIREEIRRTEARNAKLEARNRAVAREIESLTGDLEQIESHVREELGMVRKDETLYRLRPELGEDGSD